MRQRGESAGHPEEDGLIELMSLYESRIFRFLLVVLGDSDAALDCSQETFTRAFENLLRGRPVNLAWLYKVARSRAMNEFQHRKRTRSYSEALNEGAVEDGTEQRLAVEQVMAKLSAEDRSVLYLSDVAGFRTDEIATMVRAQAPAVRQRVSRARTRFRLLYASA